ncbi:MAG: thioredoxin [Fibrobacterota bacterium]
MKNRDNIILVTAGVFATAAMIFLFTARGPGKASGTAPSPGIQHVSNYNFDDVVLKADKPVLVDFWAEWCPPCRQLAPVISGIASELSGKVIVVKVDVDEAKSTAARFDVEVLPTLVLFRGGKELERTRGLIPRDSILSLLKKHGAR